MEHSSSEYQTLFFRSAGATGILHVEYPILLNPKPLLCGMSPTARQSHADLHVSEPNLNDGCVIGKP